MRTYEDIMPCKDLLCNAARSAERGSQAAGKMTAAAHIRCPVPLHICRIIRMGRPRLQRKIVIISGARIRIRDPDADRKTGRFPVKNAGNKLRNVRLFPRSRKRIPTALPPFHEPHQRVRINGFAGRKSLNERADAVSVRLSEDRNAKPLAKTRCHKPSNYNNIAQSEISAIPPSRR